MFLIEYGSNCWILKHCVELLTCLCWSLCFITKGDAIFLYPLQFYPVVGAVNSLCDLWVQTTVEQVKTSSMYSTGFVSSVG